MQKMFNWFFLLTAFGIKLNAQYKEAIAPINYAWYFDSVPNTICLVHPSTNEILFCGYTDLKHYSKYGIVLKKRDTLFWLDIEGKELGKYRASIVI